MAENLDRGTFGEQGAGFFLGPQGYFLVDGPSGTQGHAANARGFDGVAYNITRDDLIIYDNKTFESSRNVGKGTAIDPSVNLAKNLNALITHVQNMSDMPARYRIMDLLRQTLTTVTSTGVSPPPNVRIAITNFGGNSPGVTKAFGGRGVTFIDMNTAPVVPARSSRTYITKQTIPSMAQPAVAGYDARRGRVGAAAEAVRFVAKSLNDHALKVAINRELERLAAPIGEAIVRGGGALVVINIDATSPLGNVGMVIARSISSAYVVAHPNTNKQEAVRFWENQPKLDKLRPPHIQLETQLLWITAPKVP
jgi:hypothetical protein